MRQKIQKQILMFPINFREFSGALLISLFSFFFGGGWNGLLRVAKHDFLFLLSVYRGTDGQTGLPRRRMRDHPVT